MKNQTLFRNLLGITAAASVALTMAACDTRSPSEKAADGLKKVGEGNVSEGLKEVGEAIEEAPKRD